MPPRSLQHSMCTTLPGLSLHIGPKTRCKETNLRSRGTCVLPVIACHASFKNRPLGPHGTTIDTKPFLHKIDKITNSSGALGEALLRADPKGCAHLVKSPMRLETVRWMSSFCQRGRFFAGVLSTSDSMSSSANVSHQCRGPSANACAVLVVSCSLSSRMSSFFCSSKSHQFLR